MKEIKHRGYKIPEDIALTGFNNEFHSIMVEPELRTIAHPTFEMGQEAARLLIEQLDNQTRHAPRQIVMHTNLVVRRSSQINTELIN
jgi:DNA-binding LacI/PurR family transcriptional regulator